MNKENLRMQLLAGVITESQYNQKMEGIENAEKVKNLTLLKKVQSRVELINGYVDALDDDQSLRDMDEALSNAGLEEKYNRFIDWKFEKTDPGLSREDYIELYNCINQVVLDYRSKWGPLSQL